VDWYLGRSDWHWLRLLLVVLSELLLLLPIISTTISMVLMIGSNLHSLLGLVVVLGSFFVLSLNFLLLRKEMKLANYILKLLRVHVKSWCIFHLQSLEALHIFSFGVNDFADLLDLIVSDSQNSVTNFQVG
jgi:hypothetical protein